MFKSFFNPGINDWKVGERKLQFIMYLLNKLIALGILEVLVYFVLIVLKFKLDLSFVNTKEYIDLLSTVNFFYISIGGILSGIYTYGNTQEWKYNANMNQNQNRNVVSPSNTSNINITIPKKSDEVFSPPKGEV